MKNIIFLVPVFLILLSSAGFSENKIYPCYRLSKEPVLDGRIKDDPAWQNIPVATAFNRLGGKSLLALKQTFFRMGYSMNSIYIAVLCIESEMEGIKAEFKDMGKLWNEDSIEIFLFPKESEKYYQFIVNAIGSRWNRKGSTGKMPLDDWTAKVYKGADYWSLEVKIPFEIFHTTIKKDTVWTGNICRNNLSKLGDRFTCWTNLEYGFHESQNFAKINFKDKKISKKHAKEIENKILAKELEKTINVICGMDHENRFLKAANKYPDLQKEISCFLKNYNEIIKQQSSLNSNSSLKEIFLLLRKSKKLSKESHIINKTILTEAFFE